MKRELINYIRKVQGTADGRSFFDRSLLSGYNMYRDLRKKMRAVDDPSYSRLYLKTRNLKRNLEGNKPTFVTVDQASIWTLEWIKKFPRQYDLVVGVPRSGMFIASLIALKLGKGLTSPELFQQGQYWHSLVVKDRLSLDEMKHVLVVDDSMNSGRAMSRAMELIRSANKGIAVTTACLIVHERSKSKVDLYHKVVAPPRVFEWSILHQKIASHWADGNLAIDMDGVLCADCPPGVDDDEALYLEWIKNARPYLIPAFEVDAIVTSRLEKYRQETEHWLRENNIKYKELYMWDIPSKSERQGQFAHYKINQLLRIKPDMYWESHWGQSQRIWEETKIPTLCIGEMTLLS